MKKHGNKKAFSLVLAISITIIMSLLAFYILEYMIPFSRNIKGIENASKAYYQAESWIEKGLLVMKEEVLWYELPSITNLPSDSIWNNFNIIAEWTKLPPEVDWVIQWNSEFDSDWNIIRSGDPIQLEIWNDFLGSGVDIDFIFRVPDLNGPDDSAPQSLKNDASTPIINWQLSSANNVLNSLATSRIYNDKIKDSNSDSNTSTLWVNFKNLEGVDLNQDTFTFQDFYEDYTYWCETNKCTLKLSVINKLELTDDTLVPYIEWKAETADTIPLRYTIIDTSGKSYGFKKDLKVKIPQQTINEAFDFTVFQ